MPESPARWSLPSSWIFGVAGFGRSPLFRKNRGFVSRHFGTTCFGGRWFLEARKRMHNRPGAFARWTAGYFPPYSPLAVRDRIGDNGEDEERIIVTVVERTKHARMPPMETMEPTQILAETTTANNQKTPRAKPFAFWNRFPLGFDGGGNGGHGSIRFDSIRFIPLLPIAHVERDCHRARVRNTGKANNTHGPWFWFSRHDRSIVRSRLLLLLLLLFCASPARARAARDRDPPGGFRTHEAVPRFPRWGIGSVAGRCRESEPNPPPRGRVCFCLFVWGIRHGVRFHARPRFATDPFMRPGALVSFRTRADEGGFATRTNEPGNRPTDKPQRDVARATVAVSVIASSPGIASFIRSYPVRSPFGTSPQRARLFRGKRLVLDVAETEFVVASCGPGTHRGDCRRGHHPCYCFVARAAVARTTRSITH